MKFHKVTLSIGLFVILLIAFQMLPVRAIDETANIEFANLSLNQAFTNVLAAEAAGGNVTSLLSKLNVAGELIVEAERAYQNGNLADVNSKTGNAVLIANQVKSDANSLTIDSRNNSRTNFILTATFSLITIALLLLTLTVVWRRVRRRYYSKLLASKPEVVNNQAQ